MQPGDWIGIYGAAIATAVAAVQIFSYFGSKRPCVSLKARLFFFIEKDQTYRSDLLTRPVAELPGVVWLMKVWFVNIGTQRLMLTYLHFTTEWEDGTHEWNVSPEVRFPRWMDPGEQVSIAIQNEDVPTLHFGRQVTLVAGTSSGTTFKCSMGGDKTDNIQLVVDPDEYERGRKLLNESFPIHTLHLDIGDDPATS